PTQRRQKSQILSPTPIHGPPTQAVCVCGPTLPSSSTRLFAAMVARACVVGTMLEEESFAVRVESTTGAFAEPAVPKSA
ncbi:hypothetical protein, partial [Mesorhizobium sp. M1A.F.Ca.IN.020.04.1.1]